jgi:hypothetical protein
MRMAFCVSAARQAIRPEYLLCRNKLSSVAAEAQVVLQPQDVRFKR